MDPLKQLDCHLARLLEFGHLLHACSSELDEEFLCCCERARHAIKDFTHQGLDGKVSDCFPVALDALRDLHWCLGKLIIRNEGYETETRTVLNESNGQLVGFLRSFARGHITISDSWSSDVHKEILHCLDCARCAIHGFTSRGHDDSILVALDALCLRELERGFYQIFIEDKVENTTYVSFLPRFFKTLADAIEDLEYSSERPDQMKRQAKRSWLPRFFKRRADENKTTQYQSMWLTFFEQQSDEIEVQKLHDLQFFNRLADEIEARECQRMLHRIERALHSLELPETSINKQGPSVMSSCWDARINGSGSAHQLPPGLNVDDLGEIHHLRDLGGGWQGMVYKAVWGPHGADVPLTDGLGDPESNKVYEAWGRLVAVKEVRSETRSEGLEALEAVVRISSGSDSVSRSNLDWELDVLKTLNHPNIVELKGYTRKTRSAGSYGLVMELMECSLEKLLESEVEISELEKVDMLLQVARGMHFLHRDVGIMHRDLKPANILIKQLTYLPANARRLGYVVAKLADFGLSKGLYCEHKDLATADGAGCHTYKRGTSFYMAPEVRLKSPDDPSESHYSQSADVFSFGTTCFNVLTGEDTPFTQEGRPLTPSEFYRRIEQRDLDPFVIQYRQSKMTALVTKCLCLDPFVIQCRQSKMEALVTKCWSFDPANRPDFFEICQILEEEKRRILCLSTSTSQVSPPL